MQLAALVLLLDLKYFRVVSNLVLFWTLLAGPYLIEEFTIAMAATPPPKKPLSKAPPSASNVSLVVLEPLP
jgi:hypothetical protein